MTIWLEISLRGLPQEQTNAPSPPEVAANTPEHGTYEQTNSLREDEERTLGPDELVHDRVDDETRHLLQRIHRAQQKMHRAHTHKYVIGNRSAPSNSVVSIGDVHTPATNCPCNQ